MDTFEEPEKREFLESKAMGNKGETFVKNILFTSGYNIIPFGVETRSEEMKKILGRKYSSDSNKRILSMPDFIVINEERKESWFIESKYTKREFSEENNFLFKHKQIFDYLKFWKDTIIIFVFDSKPYYKCVKVEKIGKKHFAGLCKDSYGKHRELWKFNGIYQDIWEIFDKVKKEEIDKGR